MSRRFDTRDPAEFAAGVQAAVDAARDGELVVLATESVYGVGTDAFRADGIDHIRQAKGRDRAMPIPVLIGSAGMVDAVATDMSHGGKALIEHFWPGMLTIVARSQPALSWDVGGLERRLVSLRVPIHQVALRLAREIGPFAVTAANRAGQPPPRTCDEAAEQMGEAVAVYLDSGPCQASATSTVVDVTREPVVLVRPGAIGIDELRAVAEVAEVAEPQERD